MIAHRTICLLVAIASAVIATAVTAVLVDAQGHSMRPAEPAVVPTAGTILPAAARVIPTINPVADDAADRNAESTGKPGDDDGDDATDPEREASDASGDDDGKDDANAQEVKPRRAIVRVNRHETVAGYIEELDAHVLVLRTRHGDLRSFARSRILQIIELLEPEPEEANRGRIILRDGPEHRGTILEDHFDYVLMEIEGVRVRFPREIVERVVPEPTFEERYQHFKATITPDTPDRHLAFCQWLYERRRYELAHEELTVLLRHRNLVAARQLMTLVEAQLQLDQSRRDRPDGADTSSGEATSPSESSSTPSVALPDRLLTPQEVNTIRVYELDFDRPPRLDVDVSTIHKLIEGYGTRPQMPASRAERAALHRADPIEVVQLMFELRARELYPEIQVKSEPYALNLYRQRVHNAWLIPNCATSRCHGGSDGGEFFLHNRNYRDARVRFTNLLILERLKLDPQWPLINYQEPMMSRIIQYALPVSEARLPHPEVPGWEPVFSRANRNLLEDAVEWVESMMAPRPDYPIDFDPKVDARVTSADGASTNPTDDAGDEAAGSPTETEDAPRGRPFDPFPSRQPGNRQDSDGER